MDRMLVLWRHGQTAWNAEGRFLGHSDVPLDDVGEAQVERAARALAELRPEVVVTSDLGRAVASASALCRVSGGVPRLDKDLRERYGGRLEGLRGEEIDGLLASEGKDLEDFGVEPDADLAERVAASAERALEEVRDGGTAVVVSHGAAIRLGMARLLCLPPASWPRIASPGNGNWSVLAEDGSAWRLARHDVGAP
ncbi:histidine phosphatase family protein [Microbispora sp. NPDC049125]|uniref:histidine phosphatase family protein n=1 Tax=Microbispora sp. NPDC049125 TaxID=3154929 RepID=UPI0034678A37